MDRPETASNWACGARPQVGRGVAMTDFLGRFGGTSGGEGQCAQSYGGLPRDRQAGLPEEFPAPPKKLRGRLARRQRSGGRNAFAQGRLAKTGHRRRKAFKKSVGTPELPRKRPGVPLRVRRRPAHSASAIFLDFRLCLEFKSNHARHLSRLLTKWQDNKLTLHSLY